MNTEPDWCKNWIEQNEAGKWRFYGPDYHVEGEGYETREQCVAALLEYAETLG